ncbi:MAG: HAD family phosphatase [Planctomycetia bacterium]|nr:MAG: HAD family phosphatase [Planctomycetia bacterium]
MPSRSACRYDLLAVDLDGTLLDRRDRIPARNREALHRAHESGVRVVLCTGRAYAETRPVLRELGLDLDAAVTVFGALVTDVRTERPLAATPMDADTGRAVAEVFLAHGYPPVWLSDGANGVDGFEFEAPRRHAGYALWRAWSACRIESRPTPLPGDLPPPLRISIIGEHDSLAEVAGSLRTQVGDRIVFNELRVPSARVTVLEAFAAGVNKWTGIRRLCNAWGIDPQRTVAIGDEVNDVDMLRSAGLGVAMGNARPEVQSAARVVTASNEECGVAQLVERVLSGEI